MFKVDYSYLARLAQAGDDHHRCLVGIINNLAGELRYYENQSADLAYELQKAVAENKFLTEQLQENTNDQP